MVFVLTWVIVGLFLSHSDPILVSIYIIDSLFQQLEYLCWHRDGTQFMSAHADGSYITWDANDSTKHKDTASPYGT